jgi:hypothetical protein
MSIGCEDEMSVDDIIEAMRRHKIRSIKIDTSKTGWDEGAPAEAVITDSES